MNSSMRFPDFIIIGAAKCATTTLYKYLERHPNIFLSTPKEPTFFARDEVYHLGIEWYASLFDEACDKQICGEASTNYSNYPLYQNTCSRMSQLIPDAKLIYMLREPVSRAYSHYLQLIKNERVKKPGLKVSDTFEDATKTNPSIIDSSRYMLQIRQFLDYYPRENMFFLLMEDITKHPYETLRKVCSFLDIDPDIDLIRNVEIKANRNMDDMGWLLRSQTLAPLRKLPGAGLAADLIPQTIKDGVYRLASLLPRRERIEKDYIPQPMLRETKDRLRNEFKPEIQELSVFLGRDLSHWI